MPRSGPQGTATPPPGGFPKNPGDVIPSAAWNQLFADLYAIANTPTPIAYGGTGAATAEAARDALGLEIGTDIPAFAGVSGMLYGLTISNNAADATNDIDVAPGSATDSTNAHVMTLGSSITKRIDALWAVGTNQGGLDTGAIANTTYHVFQIKRLDTGVTDVLFSASPTSPTLPANYTVFRRIASFIRSAGAIRAFTQLGDEFIISTPIVSINNTGPGTSAVLYTVDVPAGVKFIAVLNVKQNVVTTAAHLISSPDAADATPDGNGIATIQNVSGLVAVETRVRTDTSGQIRARGTAASVTAFIITTIGWVDARGRT